MQRDDRLKLIAAVFGVLASLAGASQIGGLIAAGQNDFVAFYVAGREAGGGSVYDSDRYYSFAAEELAARNEALVYIRPPFYALLFKPLTALDYQQAHYFWIVLRLFALAIFLSLFTVPARVDAVLAISVSAPLASSLFNGQDIALLLVVVALALRMQKNQSWLLAGAVLSLLSIKFHLFLSLPLLIIAQRRKDLAVGFGIGCLLLTGLSFVAAGPNWPLEYLEILTQERVSPRLEIMPNIHGLVGNLPSAIWLEAGLSLAVLAASWWIFRRTSFEIAIAVMIVGGFLVSYHSYGYDGAILVPAALTLLARTKSLLVKTASLASLFPLVWTAPAPVVQAVVVVLLVAVVWDLRSCDRQVPPTPVVLRLAS